MFDGALSDVDAVEARHRNVENGHVGAVRLAHPQRFEPVARFADDADRRKAVAAQQAEATRLETAATQARDAATREETRRAQLAERPADRWQVLPDRGADVVEAEVDLGPGGEEHGAVVSDAPQTASAARFTAAFW